MDTSMLVDELLESPELTALLATDPYGHPAIYQILSPESEVFPRLAVFEADREYTRFADDLPVEEQITFRIDIYARENLLHPINAALHQTMRLNGYQRYGQVQDDYIREMDIYVKSVTYTIKDRLPFRYETEGDSVFPVRPQRQSLRSVHYAILIRDDEQGAEYEIPQPLVGAVSASLSPTNGQDRLWADDGVAEVAYQGGCITVDIELAALPLRAQAVLLGHRYERGVMIQNIDDEAPYMAIGFTSQSQPGQLRCVWLYKGRFQVMDDTYATANDSPAWRQPRLIGIFYQREYDGNLQVTADTGDTEFDGEDSWFSAVYEPVPATSD